MSRHVDRKPVAGRPPVLAYRTPPGTGKRLARFTRAEVWAWAVSLTLLAVLTVLLAVAFNFHILGIP